MDSDSLKWLYSRAKIAAGIIFLTLIALICAVIG